MVLIEKTEIPVILTDSELKRENSLFAPLDESSTDLPGNVKVIFVT